LFRFNQLVRRVVGADEQVTYDDILLQGFARAMQIAKRPTFGENCFFGIKTIRLINRRQRARKILAENRMNLTRLTVYSE
jgi:hypothetical protein